MGVGVIVAFGVVGFGAIGLGIKGFSAEGLPFSTKKRITGTPAKAIGVICIIFGLAILACLVGLAIVVWL